MMLFEYIMVVAFEALAFEERSRVWGATHLRTHGNALRTEMMMKTLVMIPAAITAGC